MADNVQLKLEYENSIRRASVSSRETLSGLKRFISSFLGVEGCDVTYRDEEGDLITVGSDVELRQLLESAQQDKRVLRFIVVQSSQSVPDVSVAEDQQQPEDEEEEEQAPQEPEFPFANLARALSEPDTVQRVQAVFQSPVITEAVTRFSRAYADTRGDAAVAGLVSAQHLPALLGVLAELVTEVPVLKDLQDLFVQQVFNRGSASAGQEVPFGIPFPFAGPFGGFGGCHRGGPGRHHGGPHHPGHHHGGPHHPGHHHGGHHPGHHHGPHPHHGPGPHGHHGGPHHPHHGPHGGPHHPGRGGCGQGLGHFGVFCDGCASDEQLKQASVREGNMNHRGFIRGTRHKSQSVNDFDLCESCKKNTARFPDSAYGPFTAIEPSAEQRGPKRFWGWQNRRQQPGEQQSWRQQPGTEGSASAPAAQPQQEWDLMDTVKAVFEQGSQMFGDANKQGELSEIYKAVIESLKPVESKQQEKQSETVPVAKPVEKPAEKVSTPTPAEDADPFVKWAAQLRQLELLGFDKLETYVEFLEEERGDLERVVNRIVRRDM